MAKRKKKVEEEQSIIPPAEELIEQPTQEILGATCSQGYDYEVPTVRSLIVDATTLELMLKGTFRPFKKYDQVNFQAVNIPASKLHFSLFLALKAVKPGGLIWVRPELATMRMFNEYPKADMGGMVRITKK
jgi:hypothetical protein